MDRQQLLTDLARAACSPFLTADGLERLCTLAGVPVSALQGVKVSGSRIMDEKK